MPLKMKEFSGETKNQNVQSWVDQLTTVQDITGWSDEIMIKHCAMYYRAQHSSGILPRGVIIGQAGNDFRESW